jgi:hypothetical protein
MNLLFISQSIIYISNFHLFVILSIYNILKISSSNTIFISYKYTNYKDIYYMYTYCQHNI